MMKCLYIMAICCFGGLFVNAAEIPKIKSINVYAQPTIYGGFAFYINNDGDFLYQNIHNNNKESGLSEKRYESKLMLKDFIKLAKTIQLNNLLTYKEGKTIGRTDDIKIYIQVELLNGAKIVASKWGSDKIKKLEPILKKVFSIVNAYMKKNKPIIRPYKSADFNNYQITFVYWKILDLQRKIE